LIKLNKEKEIKNRVESLKDGCWVSAHHDADGITSLYFITLVFEVLGYYFPTVFGDQMIPLDGGKKTAESDIMVDMVPRLPTYKGLVFDHHIHKDPYDYLLVHGPYPACMVVYNYFKDLIPEKERWKLAIGLVGDGRSELIPAHFWKDYPFLGEEFASYRTSRTGYQYLAKTPMWFKLSAPINYACRINKPRIAIDVIKAASEPLDILRDQSLESARNIVSKEITRESRDMLLVDMGKVVVGIVDSEFVIESILAGRISGTEKKPIVIMNKNTGNMSMRGVSTDYIVAYLSDRGYEVGGHSGFAGGHCDKSYKELLKDLRGL